MASFPRLAILTGLALFLAVCGNETAPSVDVQPGARNAPAPDDPRSGVPPWAQVAPEQIAAAAEHGVPVTFENDRGMRFVLIPAGTFLMGSPFHERGRDQDEEQQTVRISKPYYMQATEVTNAQFRMWRPHHDSDLTQESFTLNLDAQPVHTHFRAASRFARWLSAGDAARSYRLATEAEWEYACRAGTRGPYHWGTTLADAYLYENYFGILLERRFDSEGCPLPDRDGHAATAPVGSYRPNPWGLHDMLGNMDEWCRDYYAEFPWSGTDAAVPVVDPTGPAATDARVVRSSYCQATLDRVRCASRDRLRVLRDKAVSGLRLVSPLPESGE